MKVATFRIINTKTSELINTYELEYADAAELNKLFQEARQVWAEYQVEAKTDTFILNKSHTYYEELMIEQEREIELQFEYMNGAYDE